MTTYKQWHDENFTFNTETKLYFCQCDMNHKLSMQEVLRLTTNCAVEDFAQRGMTWQFLADNHVAILVSRSAFRFHKLPKADDVITVSTWEEKAQPLQLMRNYKITSQSGELLVSGYGAWILVDPVQKRILRTKDFTLRPESTRFDGHDCMEPGKIIAPQQMQSLGEREIHFSEIDGNGHVNNANYMAFVMDALPAEYQQKEFTDLRINYAKEAMLGTKLSLTAAYETEAKKIVVVGKTDEGVCFESELYYK